MKSWVLVFFSNRPYIHKAIETIRQARSVGKWTDDIVLMLSSDLYNDSEFQDLGVSLRLILREVSERDTSSVLNVWKKHPENPHYEYVINRGFIYNKFQIFDVYFKKWDIVFYLDSGARIQGPLERMKIACEPNNCLYAHSDAYPTYKWKLERQFLLELLEDRAEFVATYGSYLDKNYFQSTIVIYDTNIIEPGTVNQLYALNKKYPVAMRMDQGILNLHFLCERNLWRQLPVVDMIGFLYDYHVRNGINKQEYLILKNDWAST